MKRNFFLLTTIVFILIALVTSNSFAYKKVKCFMLQKPDQLLPGVSRIAILDFEGEGDYGRYLADQFIEELLKEGRGITSISGGLFSSGKEGQTYLAGATTKIFDIVERSALETVLREQNLNMTGLVDISQASEVGKVLGVNAIITGKYSILSEDTPTREERTYYKNKRKYTTIVDCITRKTTVSASIRIIGIETAQILGNYSNSAKAEQKKCEEEISKLTPREMQVQACMNTLGNAFASYINPYFVKLEIELEKIKTKEFEKRADEAANAAEKDDIDRAYLLYYSIYQEDQYDPKVLYNLGVLNEVVGNFKEANQMYANALQLEDNKRFKESIARVNKYIELFESLSTVGINLTKHEFETSQAAVAELKVEKIKIKGKREERFEIKETPQITGNSIARIPGGIQVKVIKYEGGWYLIELPDGKQGYIQENLCEK